MPVANVHRRRCAYQATRPGDKLLEDRGCRRCSPETGGMGAVAIELVRMVDIRNARGMTGSTLSACILPQWVGASTCVVGVP